MNNKLKQNADDARLSLLSLIRGYRVSNVLFLAHKLEIFKHLSISPLLIDELSAATSVPAPHLRHLLSVLTGMNLLSNVNDKYALTAPFKTLLDPQNDNYIGPLIDSALGENHHWTEHSKQIMENTYSGAYYAGECLNTDTVYQTLKSVEASNRSAILLVWPFLEKDLDSVDTLLDLGAGHGLFSSGVLERAPKAHADLVDLYDAINFCKQRHLGKPYVDRMSFYVGDALTINYNAQYDMVFANDLLVYFNKEQKREILRNCYTALRPGGRLVMTKIALNYDRQLPHFGAMFSLNMFITSLSGYLETDEEAMLLCEEVGFFGVNLFQLSSDRSLVIAQK